MRLKNRQKGFTLIELLVVIAVLVLIASVVFVATGSIQDKAKIAKSRVEITEIMKAAELVHNNFGYYPNDSHGSPAICLNQIVINGGTFGSYINLCNDPYGQPYEWNNICGNGEQRKSDGSGIDCPPNSDDNPGAVGILYLGPNKVSENCSGDDTCFGFRGHSAYNWQSSGGDDGGAVCGDSVIEGGETCDDGDLLNGICPATCSASCTINSCAVCGNSVIEGGETCDDGDLLNGICPATCSASCTINSCAVCGDLFCDAGGGEDCFTCFDDCGSPNPGICSGSYTATCSGLPKGTCQNEATCTWNNGPKTCTGTYGASCAGFDDNQAGCDGEVSCTWNFPSCP